MKVFYFDSYTKCALYIKRQKEGHAVINLDDSFGAYTVGDSLKKIPLTELTDAQRDSCAREFIEMIDDLSRIYGKDHSWWANMLSEKNEHLSTLYKNLYTYYRLQETLGSLPEALVCVVGQYPIGLQIQSWCKNKGCIFVWKGPFRLWVKIKSGSISVLRGLYFCCKGWIRKFQIASLANSFKKKLKRCKNAYCIRTWLNQGFLQSWNKKNDLYFGRLPWFLGQQGKDIVIVAGVFDRFESVLSEIKKENDFIVIPEEYFLRWYDYLRVFDILRKSPRSISCSVTFRGYAVDELVNHEYNSSFSLCASHRNLLQFYVGKRLADEVDIVQCIYTFENYGWEKLFVSGIRSQSRPVKIVGFQHSFLTPNSFKYFQGNIRSMPAPDKIITVGAVTKRILEERAGLGFSSVSIGGALKQEHLHSLSSLKRSQTRNVLVPLTMNKEEAFKILEFLRLAEKAREEYTFVIRPHPFSARKLLSEYNEFLSDNTILRGDSFLSQELKEACAILYSWSSVAIEALMLGVPAIYMDLLRPMHVDPLFECSYLKESVSSPSQLITTLDKLHSLSATEFSYQLQKAKEYLKMYFEPVSDRSLSTFMVN